MREKQKQYNSTALRPDEIPKLSRDEYAKIGLVAVKKYPEKVRELIQSLLENLPIEWDQKKIKSFYIPGIDRKIFIGIINLLYHSEIDLKAKKFSPKRGIVKNIAGVLDMASSNTSVLIQEVVVSLKVYDSFRTDVENAIKILDI
jgi:hypothetical protein